MSENAPAVALSDEGSPSTPPSADETASASWPRAGLLVAGGLAVANVLAYGLTVVVSRWVGPVDFGAIGALLGILTIGTVPALALQPVVARHTALERHADAVDTARSDLAAVRAAVVVGLGLGVVTLAATPVLSATLHLDSPLPVVWLALALAPTPVVMGCEGLLQGRERFVALTILFVTFTGSRLVGALVLVQAGYGVAGTIAGTALGGLCTAGVALALVRPARRNRSRLPHGFVVELTNASAAMLGLFILANADVLLARHFLPARQAGLYAVGAVVAKVAFWGPQFVSVLAFPRLARTRDRDRRSLLHRSLVGVALLGAVAVLVSLVAARPLLRLFLGDSYEQLAPAAWLFAAAGAGLALANLLLYASLAARGRRASAAVAVAAATEVAVVVTVAHHSLRQVVTTVMATGILLTVGGLVAELRIRRHEPEPIEARAAVPVRS